MNITGGQAQIDKNNKKIRQLKMENHFIRNRQVMAANKSFNLNSENVAKLLEINDMLYRKMFELIAKIQETEKKMSGEPDYDISATLYCTVPIGSSNEDYDEFDIFSFGCDKDRPFTLEDRPVKKNFCLCGYSELGEELSWPFYCLVEENIIPLVQIINLTKSNIFTQIKIYL